MTAVGTPAVMPPVAAEAPHSTQKRAPGGISALQLVHFAASTAPQDMQKRARSGFSVEQLGQLMPAMA